MAVQLSVASDFSFTVTTDLPVTLMCGDAESVKTKICQRCELEGALLGLRRFSL